MSIISLSSAEKTFTLFFTPARECLHCPRHSHYGIGEQSGRTVSLEPRCHLHGYYDVSPEEQVSKRDREQEYASITRFIVWAHDDRGHALVIGPCPVSAVPGYQEEEHTSDWTRKGGYTPKAWSVRYELSGEVTHVYVVYDYRDWKLSLYRDGEIVSFIN